jgi:hypothetical protein
MTLGAAAYDAATNTQTQPLTIAKGKYPAVANLLVLKFEQTQQTATGATGSGFRDLQVLMPGFGSGAKATQLFSDNWAAMMSVFDHHRWMGATGTCLSLTRTRSRSLVLLLATNPALPCACARPDPTLIPLLLTGAPNLV